GRRWCRAVGGHPDHAPAAALGREPQRDLLPSAPGVHGTPDAPAHPTFTLRADGAAHRIPPAHRSHPRRRVLTAGAAGAAARPRGGPAPRGPSPHLAALTFQALGRDTGG